jgi:hypothetical protein
LNQKHRRRTGQWLEQLNVQLSTTLCLSGFVLR